MSKTRDPAKTPPRAAPLGCRPRSGACVACSCLRGVRSRGRFRPARALVAVRVTLAANDGGFGGTFIPVASIKHLLVMKTLAGRP